MDDPCLLFQLLGAYQSWCRAPEAHLRGEWRVHDYILAWRIPRLTNGQQMLYNGYDVADLGQSYTYTAA
jgi:hypothetical protein